MRLGKIVFIALGALALLAACSDDDPPATPTPKLTREQLTDGRVCATCHPDHFREWSGSMHAYAGQDPVFLALNKRMQRETNGQNGNFCVNCHAPVAVRLGLTTDGTNLGTLDPSVVGVTCFFCHSSLLNGGTLNNNPLQLATDNVMRGGFADPVANEGHRAMYDPYTDYKNDASSLLCGVCHDIVNPKGTPIERTFREWRASDIALEQRKNCGGCHMPERTGLAAQAPGVLVRKVHDHSLPGVDTALTPFPETTAQRDAVQKLLDASLSAKLCVRAEGTDVVMEVTLLNETVGHNFPSGAAQDRRAWVEIEARRGGSITFTSGRVADRVAASGSDPQLFLLHDTHFDETGKETHFFWNTTKFEPHTVPIRRSSRDPDSTRSLAHRYTFAGALPDEVTMHLRLRAVDFDLLEELVGSGDLDPAVAAAVPTFTLRGGELTWRAGTECVSTKPY
jgi:hypothetical protein